MAIKFRCPTCQQFLGISDAKAGQTTECPACYHEITVPTGEAPIGKNRWSGSGNPVAGVKPPTQPRPSSPSPEPDSEVFEITVDDDSGVMLETVDSDEVEFGEELLEPAPPTPPPVAPPSVATPSVTPTFPTTPRARPVDPAKLQGIARKQANSSTKIASGFQMGAGVILGIAVASALAGAVISEAMRTPLAAASSPSSITDGSETEIPEHRRIRGLVTYADSNGQSKVDRGAIVLVLPLYRQGTAKISGEGLKIGADAKDVSLLEASAQALGGNSLIANDDGSFLINVPTQGRFGLLVISRSQSRPVNSVPTASCRRFLENYFERPETVLGTQASEFREVVIDGIPQASRTIHFVNN